MINKKIISIIVCTIIMVGVMFQTFQIKKILTSLNAKEVRIVKVEKDAYQNYLDMIFLNLKKNGFVYPVGTDCDSSVQSKNYVIVVHWNDHACSSCIDNVCNSLYETQLCKNQIKVSISGVNIRFKLLIHEKTGIPLKNIEIKETCTDNCCEEGGLSEQPTLSFLLSGETYLVIPYSKEFPDVFKRVLKGDKHF